MITSSAGGIVVVAVGRDDGDLDLGKDAGVGESCDMTASSLPTDCRFRRFRPTAGSFGATIVARLFLGRMAFKLESYFAYYVVASLEARNVHAINVLLCLSCG